MNINDIKTAIELENYKITLHALKEKDADTLTLEEIIQSIISGEIIEDYKNSKPFQSCLVFGFNFKKEPIHSVWGYDEKTKIAILITVYRPNPLKWVEYKKRKTNE